MARVIYRRFDALARLTRGRRWLVLDPDVAAPFAGGAIRARPAGRDDGDLAVDIDIDWPDRPPLYDRLPLGTIRVIGATSVYLAALERREGWPDAIVLALGALDYTHAGESA